ncbi:MAG: Hpt domain-containing protein [Rhodocyclaceae bacterium]|nr:Hpt domain-containing protein [Rhodocyclaceae bacterium]
MRGKVEFYRLLLDEYAAHNADALARFRQALAAGDRPTAARLIHTLKGVAGTLGITSVHRKAAELDQALREGGSDELIERLTTAIERAQAEALTTIGTLGGR